MMVAPPDTNTRQGCGGRPRRIGGHSCWQLRQVLHASDSVSSTEWLSVQVYFEVVHTVQTLQLVCLVAFVDVPVTMQLVFLQSKSYVFCAAFQFLVGVWDIPVVPQNEIPHCSLTVQSICVHRQGRRHPCSSFQKWNRFSQSSTGLNDNLEAGLAHFSDSPARC